jgi:hypothetical protein
VRKVESPELRAESYGMWKAGKSGTEIIRKSFF